MISPNIQIFDLDGEKLSRLITALDPPPGDDMDKSALGFVERATRGLIDDRNAIQSEEEELPIVAIVENERVLCMFELGKGYISHEDGFCLNKLEQFCENHGYSFVVVIDRHAVQTILAEAQQQLTKDHNMFAYGLSLLRILERALARGDIDVFPNLNALPTIPTTETAQRIFDLLLPDNQFFAFYLTNQDKLWTSLIVGKRAGNIDQITSHMSIRVEVPFRSIRQSAKSITQTIQRRFGPVHAAVFLPLSVWHQFVNGDRSAIGRAMASRRAVIDPCPAWLMTLVGAGAISEAASRSAELATKVWSKSPIAGRLFASKLGTFSRTVSNPLEAVGLDAWQVIRAGRVWTRRLRPFIT